MVTPRCPIHYRPLLCPACMGGKGGRNLTPAKRDQLAKMRKTKAEKLAANLERVVRMMKKEKKG